MRKVLIGAVILCLISTYGFLVYLIKLKDRVILDYETQKTQVESFKKKSNQLYCAINLKTIGASCRAYAKNHGGLFPEDLSDLYPIYISDIRTFVCPNTSQYLFSPAQIRDYSGYVYVKGMTQNADSLALLSYDKKGNHEGKGQNELYVNGLVAWKKLD